MTINEKLKLNNFEKSIIKYSNNKFYTNKMIFSAIILSSVYFSVIFILSFFISKISVYLVIPFILMFFVFKFLLFLISYYYKTLTENQISELFIFLNFEQKIKNDVVCFYKSQGFLTKGQNLVIKNYLT